MCLTGVLVNLGEHQRGVGLHAAGSTNLIFKLHFPGNSSILDRQAVLPPLPLCFPTPTRAPVDHGIGVPGTAAVIGMQDCRIRILQCGNDWVLTGPQRSPELRQKRVITIQRGSRFHLTCFEIYFQNHCPGEAKLDDFFEEDGENLLWAFGGEQPQSCRFAYGIARNEYLGFGPQLWGRHLGSTP